VRALFLFLAVPMVGISLVIMAVCHRPFVAETAERRRPAARLRGHDHADLLDRDLLSVFQMTPNRIFTARLSYSVMLVAIGAG
jgi:hypothetical protein